MDTLKRPQGTIVFLRRTAIWYNLAMTTYLRSMTDEEIAAAEEWGKTFPSDHKQVPSTVLNASIDAGIVHLIDYLSRNGVVTLHCCEGGKRGSHPGNADGEAYIHFLNVAELERALLLLASLARENDDAELEQRIFQGRSARSGYGKEGKWTFSVSWSCGIPHSAVPASERRGPEETVFTAAMYFPRADALALDRMTINAD